MVGAPQQQNWAQYWGAGVAVDEALQGIVASGPPDRLFGDRIRRAFVLLEQRIRAKASLAEHDFGKELVDKAFLPDKGILQPVSPVAAERSGLHQLLVGAFLYYRNPIAHRPITHDKQSAWQVFHLINHLLSLVEQAAQASFDIFLHVGAHEGQILRRRDFRLDIDGDGDLDIVTLLELGPRLENSELRMHKLPVVLHKEADGYRRIPAEGLRGGSIHGPFGVQLRNVTSSARADLVVTWGAGESTAECFILRWQDDRYVIAQRDMTGVVEPMGSLGGRAFFLHMRQNIQFADVDGDGLAEIVQELLFNREEVQAHNLQLPEVAEGDWRCVCRVNKWDAQKGRIVPVEEVVTVGTGYYPGRYKVVEPY